MDVFEPEKLVELIPLDEDQPYIDRHSGEVALFYTVITAHPEPGFDIEISSLSRYSTGVILKVANRSRASIEKVIRDYLEKNEIRFIK